MERLLSVSRELRDKVQENESAASELLKQSEELREELKAMRQVSARESGREGERVFILFCLNGARVGGIEMSLCIAVRGAYGARWG